MATETTIAEKLTSQSASPHLKFINEADYHISRLDGLMTAANLLIGEISMGRDTLVNSNREYKSLRILIEAMESTTELLVESQGRRTAAETLKN